MPVQYDKNPFLVIDRVMQTISSVRPGKGDTGVYISLHEDYLMAQRFRYRYLNALSNETRKVLIDTWNEFIFKREEENYPIHQKSVHKALYQSLFTQSDETN